MSKKNLIITDSQNHIILIDALPEKERANYDIISHDDAVLMTESDAGEFTTVWQDTGDALILNKFKNAVCKYADGTIDWTQPKNKILSAIATMPILANPQTVDDEEDDEEITESDKFVFSTGQPSSAPTNLTIWKPLDEQRKIFENIIKGKRIIGDSVSQIAEQVVNLCLSTDLFLIDIYSQKVHSVFLTGNKKANEKDAKNVFLTHFKRCCFIRKKTTDDNGATKTAYAELKIDEFGIIWSNIVSQAKYSERIRYMESLPQWDGVPRIKTFLKEYYNCDTNPNFFLLLYTHVVGKMINPEENYCPYFFDITGEQQGCLLGDTEILVYKENARGTMSQTRKQIQYLFMNAKTESTIYKVRSFNTETNRMEYSNAKVIYSGDKECYEVITNTGKKIKCSGNHRFFNGKEWINLKDLKIGDNVFVYNGELADKNTKQKRNPSNDSKEILVKFHPVINKTGKRIWNRKKTKSDIFYYHRIPIHRAILEAHENNMTLEQYKNILDNYNGFPLVFIPKQYEIHHKNGNHLDNSIENLEIIGKKEHGEIHGKTQKFDRYTCGIDEISDIIPIGVHKTYDLECVEGQRNYVANDFITHNTGKSTLARMLIGGNDYHLAGNFANAVDGNGRSSEDFINKCYSANNAIIIDDELAWEESKVFNNETFKAFITYQQDTFSKKNKDEQSIPRTFITIRTSNYIRNVYEVDGRRQIVFEVNLKRHELRIKNAPKDIFKLLLCEAYAYYKENGIYELTEEERELQTEQNKKYYNFDDANMNTVQDYIFEITTKPESPYKSEITDKLGVCGDWRSYSKFCKDNKDKPLYGPHFWDRISTLSKFKEKGIISKDEDDKNLIKKIKGTRMQYFIAKKTRKDDLNIDEIPDFPL